MKLSGEESAEPPGSRIHARALRGVKIHGETLIARINLPSRLRLRNCGMRFIAGGRNRHINRGTRESRYFG